MSGVLKGKAALVTGASSGLGAGIALALAAAGASVAVTARRADRLQDLVKKIEASGSRGLALAGDIADEASAKGFVTETIKQFGRLDILVNSAGLNAPGEVENANTEDFRHLLNVNVLGTLYTCAVAIPQMRAQGGGDIINISSIAGRRATGEFNPYSTSKFALNAMTEGMRQECGKKGVRVCVIEPGATRSEVASAIRDPGVAERIHKHVSRPDAMAPEDIAAAVMFVVTLPPRANVSEILIRPTTDVLPL
jgi:NADP-dependent 3-hydroxy acid dehydrogenase YdfG